MKISAERKGAPFRSAFFFPAGQWLRIYKTTSLRVRCHRTADGEIRWRAELPEARTEPPDVTTQQIGLDYVHLAADNGLPRAQYFWGVNIIESDAASGARYLKLAADNGIPDAQLEYAVCLSNGCGVPVNTELAAHYYKLAADNSDSDGQYRYGVMLEGGIGIPVNKELAALYYKIAADK